MQTVCGRTRSDWEIVALDRTLHLLFWPAAGVFCLDQLTKLFVASHIGPFQSIEVIPRFFNLVHIHNRGMAFGLMNRPGHTLPFILLTASSLAVMGILILWHIKVKEKTLLHGLGSSLIIGGAAGNVMDRLRLGKVVDFLDFYIGKFHWPAFNIADASITIGTCLLAIYVIMAHRSNNVS